MPNPRQVHSGATRVLSFAMLAIGGALLVQAIAVHGGSSVLRVVLGILFLCGGAGRLYVETRRGDRPAPAGRGAGADRGARETGGERGAEGTHAERGAAHGRGGRRGTRNAGPRSSGRRR
ncbi:MAG TPA: hypothetical protein VHX88_02590 [Solirubrobacteraceae bacterium]|nr:hypothetical protein [Solirubrobacteraceae bacterium]